MALDDRDRARRVPDSHRAIGNGVELLEHRESAPGSKIGGVRGLSGRSARIYLLQALSNAGILRLSIIRDPAVIPNIRFTPVRYN